MQRYPHIIDETGVVTTKPRSTHLASVRQIPYDRDLINVMPRMGFFEVSYKFSGDDHRPHSQAKPSC
ncbi:hypothetical protein PAXRUDRAFT_827957 [Paxillus rubicundulus Ve08.2h10]|uniref:Uncharacterized protein n=1 Tax=Paxillus rubicundulus Ve08.2h10 TaxID=930991 RepID=A0A0D0DBG2_9AGAM|nr:hypothetical protein PAXRUDRAFT_827957 [Paxillus rubicundulus Ve08.2h10]